MEEMTITLTIDHDAATALMRSMAIGYGMDPMTAADWAIANGYAQQILVALTQAAGRETAMRVVLSMGVMASVGTVLGSDAEATYKRLEAEITPIAADRELVKHGKPPRPPR